MEIRSLVRRADGSEQVFSVEVGKWNMMVLFAAYSETKTHRIS